MQQVLIRRLLETDIPSALELSSAAGWNQTEADWRLLLTFSPEGCLALKCDGVLAATATLVCYGARLAWIGMVLTRTGYQRRGYATSLLKEALRIADAREIETVKLDATEMGQPLYESLGFRPEQSIERWQRRGMPLSFTARAMVACDAAVNDPAAFGADRSRLLDALKLNSSVTENKFARLFTRPGRNARYLGPCVAAEEASARELIEAALAGHTDLFWYWDLLPGNESASRLASALGFSAVRKLVRMSRGNPCSGRLELIYAIAGFELG